jgi:hypothetical protein
MVDLKERKRKEKKNKKKSEYKQSVHVSGLLHIYFSFMVGLGINDFVFNFLHVHTKEEGGRFKLITSAS